MVEDTGKKVRVDDGRGINMEKIKSQISKIKTKEEDLFFSSSLKGEDEWEGGILWQIAAVISDV